MRCTYTGACTEKRPRRCRPSDLFEHGPKPPGTPGPRWPDRADPGSRHAVFIREKGNSSGTHKGPLRCSRASGKRSSSGTRDPYPEAGFGRVRGSAHTRSGPFEAFLASPLRSSRRSRLDRPVRGGRGYGATRTGHRARPGSRRPRRRRREEAHLRRRASFPPLEGASRGSGISESPRARTWFPREPEGVPHLNTCGSKFGGVECLFREGSTEVGTRGSPISGSPREPFLHSPGP